MNTLSLSFSLLFDRSSTLHSFHFESPGGSGPAQPRSFAIELPCSTAWRSAKVSIDESTLNIHPELIPIYSVPVRTTILVSDLGAGPRDDPLESTRGI